MLSHDTKCNTIDVIYMEQDKLSLPNYNISTSRWWISFARTFVCFYL